MGTRTVVAKVRGSLNVALKNDIDTDETAMARAALGEALTVAFTSGTTANTADRVFCRKALTVDEASDPTTIDLHDFASQNMGAGAGLDGLGQTLGFVEVVALLIKNHSDSAGNLLVGGEGTAAAWNTLFKSQTAALDDAMMVIKPGGFLLVVAPPDPAYAVADSTNHLLDIDSTSGVCTYDIYILGRSA